MPSDRDLRRWIPAFAALVLVIGWPGKASAQTLACTASASVVPTLRHEGFTELTGDIVLTCPYGPNSPSTPQGSPIPQASITLTLNAPVTSRVMGGSSPQLWTEALLVVDDPSPANQDPCLSPTNPAACVVTGDGGQTFNQPGKFNVFQGVSGGPGTNSITFQGVPVDPIGANFNGPPHPRTYRITNVRIDATALAALPAGPSPVSASLTVSPNSSMTIGNQPVTVGFASDGLTTSTLAASPPFQQCVTYSTTTVGTVTFAESFATAFKVAGSSGQSTPGSVYNTESGLEIAVSGGAAGAANTGTRLQTTISNIPPGVTILVDNWAQSPASIGCASPGFNNAGCTLVSDATLVTAGTPADPGQNTITAVTNGGQGSATVVWEVTNTNPAALDSLAFRIYAAFTGGLATANLATAAVSGYSPQFGALASAGPIPEFSSTVNVPAAPTSLFTIATCPEISGQVTLSGTGLSGVAMTLTGTESETIATNSSGNYSFSVPGGNYTVTPSLRGYIFTPLEQTFNNLSVNQTANFIATSNAPAITSISPLPAGRVGAAYAQTLTATGGIAPYAWAISAGALPAGLTLNPATGQIGGTPTTAGAASFTIQVTDSQELTGAKSFTLAIAAALAITSSSPLPSGTLSAPYSQTLAATGGTPPYSWALSQGSLPAGLSLNSASGAIGGTPTLSGVFNFAVQVTDANRVAASAQFTLTINAALTITSAPLSSCTVGASCQQTVAVSGGTPPYTWALSAGALPAGLSLNSATGQIAGTPTASGVASFTIGVTDSNGATASQPYKLTVNPPPAITTVSPLPGGTANAPYTFTLQSTGGTPPDTWALSAGKLPAGLSLNAATGQISGTPTASGTASFTVQVTDANGASADALFTLAITSNPAITTASPLPGGTVGAAYTFTLQSAGGRPPYTWAVSSGALPAGLSLNAATGQISGTPTASGVASFTIGLTDSNRATASQQYKLTVNPPPAVTTASPLPGGTVGTVYTFTLQSTGGTPPKMWAVSSGALPAGLSLNASTGSIGGTPATAGTANFTMQVTDANGASASVPFALTITTNPAITTATLPAPALGSAYSVQLSAAGTAPPFAWSISAGALPAGLTLNSGGLLSGTPNAPGTFTFTVQVTDASNNIATTQYSLTVPQIPLTLTIQAPTGPAMPQQQLPITVTLPQAYPVDLAGELSLQFTPNPAAPVVDPAIQFNTGGVSVAFQIPAGQTGAVFPQPQLAVQSGTVAGSITLTATATAGGVPVTPSGSWEVTVHLPQEPPAILSVSIQTASSGFNVEVTGYSNTREITQATFTFTPAAGSQVQTTSFTPAGVSAAFQGWYGMEASTAFGSEFLYTQPFTITTGSASALQSVTVTLTNTQGTSSAMTANF